MENAYDIAVVGGGPAGLTAAIYARRAGRTVLVLEKETFGGQIASSPLVENYPGVPSVSGAELADRLYTQADSLGARLELEEVLEIRSEAGRKILRTEYASYSCRALILAMGMKHRKLSLPGEDTLKGISWCAVCDGSFYQGQDVAVCGGGNTALQDALFLSDLCRSVTLIHRRGEFRGDPVLAEQAGRRPNVTVLLHTVVTALEGETALRGLRLRQVETGEERALAVTGLFEAVGQVPEGALSGTVAPVDDAGFLLAGESCRTSADGVFAAGDCRTKDVRQLTTACADGAVAAVAACRYCQEF